MSLQDIKRHIPLGHRTFHSLFPFKIHLRDGVSVQLGIPFNSIPSRGIRARAGDLENPFPDAVTNRLAGIESASNSAG